jgi:hypothetical protein
MEQMLEHKVEKLYSEARIMLAHMEKHIPDLYSAGGMYKAYVAGYFPVPDLWECRDEMKNATNWDTSVVDGTVALIDKHGKKMTMEERLVLVGANLKELH